MLHTHIKHHIQRVLEYSVDRASATLQTTSRWHWSAAARPRVMAELLLDIACQNKFMLFTGLDFHSLHHKPHYNTHIYSAQRIQLLIWDNTQTGGGCVKKNKKKTTSSFLSNSHLWNTLNASWLLVPLGIASLMNTNGKAYFNGRVWIMEVLW